MINITPTPLLNNRTPFEQLFHKAAPYKSVKVFGCIAYVNTTEYGKSKFDPRSRKFVHLGNAVNKKGYVLLDLSSRKLFVSRNVTFQETEFPFSNSTKGSQVELSSHSYHSTSFPSVSIPIPDSIPSIDHSSDHHLNDNASIDPCDNTLLSSRRSTRTRHLPRHF